MVREDMCLGRAICLFKNNNIFLYLFKQILKPAIKIMNTRNLFNIILKVFGLFFFKRVDYWIASIGFIISFFI